MKRIELELILKIIDTHTVRRTYNYGAPDTSEITNVPKLKHDIIKCYEEIMKEER